MTESEECPTSAYTNTGGFLWWYHDGGLTGVPGDGNYVEAFQIQLTGDAERLYDVYYSATSTGQGKMGWAMNGQDCRNQRYR